MIIETPLKDGDVVTMKTIGGEEIVARFVEEKDGKIVIAKPMTVMVSQQGIGLGPFAFTINPGASVPMNPNALLFIRKSDGEMAKQYLQSSSGIDLSATR